ncbi:MAG: histidinol-phosphate transaminase [Clostridia bacterium]|nr:histidinol-phosphate transaminase [Clostridia bacterium]
MSKFMSKRHDELDAYVPGEQPQDKKYVKLNTNESPFPPSPFAQRLARQAAGTIELYCDPESGALVRIAAEKFGVAEDEIIFTNGSDEVLDFAFAAFCDDKTPAVFPDITYGFYPVFATRNGVPYREIPLKEDLTVNVEDYFGVKGTVFIANPNAPTGIALPAAEIEKIVKANPDNVVVVDEAYVDFGGESVLPLIKKYDNLLVTETFSKSRSLAGGRLGMGFANKALIADIKKIKYSFNPYNVNSMTAAAGIGALLDEEYFKANVATIIKTRENTVFALEKLGFTTLPSKANFIFAKHAKMSGKCVYSALKDKGVLVRYFDKDRLRDYVRITVGSAEDMRVLAETLADIIGEQK